MFVLFRQMHKLYTYLNEEGTQRWIYSKVKERAKQN
jgi:hypothetical protein